LITFWRDIKKTLESVERNGIMAKIGERAPEFTLQDAEGNSVSLADFRGKKVVLYFYPKDDTPGCTQESCEFRDSREAFAGVGTIILGVSPDGVESHRKFRDKFDLPFPLLADPERQAIEAYGVWKEKNMYGKKYMGVERSTFLIDEEGILVEEKRKVKVDGHVAEMLGLVTEG
jgi:thioredoxin-dependent peroxiredoxin